MSVTEHLMRLGSWNLSLIPEAPKSVRQAVDLFDHVVITASPVTPVSSDANMLASSIYTGVILERDEFTLAGCSPLWWLGTDEGVGPFPVGVGGNEFETRTTAVGVDKVGTWDTSGITAPLGTILAYAFDVPINDITLGTVNGAGLTSIVASGPITGTFRELLDFLCGLAGAEYRMKPNFTLDVASAANLFVATPTVVVTRKDGGPDGSRQGVRGPNLSIKNSGRSITTHVRVYTDPLTVGSADAVSFPKAPSNSNATFIRRTTSTDPGAVGSNLNAVATSLLNLYSTTRDTITLDSAEYAVTRFVTPGDTVYAYDPQAGLNDTANQITYRGETISPIKLRLKSVTWPIEQGMGVYLRQTGATPSYVDLTQWVAFEGSGGGLDSGANDASSTPEGWGVGAQPEWWGPRVPRYGNQDWATDLHTKQQANRRSAGKGRW